VVAVDQGGVEGADGAEDVEAQGLVEDVAAAEAGPVLLRVVGRDRVDDVQLRVRGQVVEHQGGVLAPQGADLDDATGSGGSDRRRDDGLPEREHGPLAVGGWGRGLERWNAISPFADHA
jgi:hypothetical protein